MKAQQLFHRKPPLWGGSPLGFLCGHKDSGNPHIGPESWVVQGILVYSDQPTA